jgi:uroporphyrinogen-III decarboxylase
MTDPQGQQLTPSAKLAARMKQWKAAEGTQFASPEVRQAYQRRVQMFIDAISLKKPERVPVYVTAGVYPMAYAGITAKDGMYDYQKLGYAMRKFNADFCPDTLASSAKYGSGRAFEILDYKLYRWPGHGVPETASFQCVEAEYMRAEEYDALIQDPSDFFIRYYLPRCFGALEGWKDLGALTVMQELPFTAGALVPYGLPSVQEAFKKLLDAGKAALEWIQACIAIDNASRTTLGLPSFLGGSTKAPFDILGDTLRGTKHILLDKFKRPRKVLEALERLVPLAISQGVAGFRPGGSPLIFMPLHKGADGFMSDSDFNTYYWPTLKAVILGLIEHGLVPFLFVEGAYNQRLDVIADHEIPAGKTVWMFDQSDMRAVKKRFQGWACFTGNVPSSLLTRAATPAQVRDFVKRLIEDVGQDGGYILSNGAVIDEAEAANLHAMIDTCKQYGVYR